MNRILQVAMESGEIIRVYREGLEDGWADGYVVAVGPKFFVIELIDKGIRFDGFNCLRYADITECECPAPNAAFLKIALAARKLSRSGGFKVDVSSLPALLRTAGESFPLVTLHTEYNSDG